MGKQQRTLLPHINKYVDFLGQFTQQQSNLRQREYAYGKKQQGEQFIADYGARISKATDTEGLLKSMNEALTYAGTNDLTQYMPVIEASARNQSMLLQEEEKKKSLDIMFDNAIKSYGDATVNWEGKTNNLGVVATQIKGSNYSSETKAQLMDLLMKNIGQTSEQLIIPKTGNEYKVGQDIKDPATGKVLGNKFGKIIFDKDNNKYYADYNEDKQFSKGEEIEAKTVAQMQEVEFNKQLERQRQAERYKPIRMVASNDGGKTFQSVQMKGSILYDFDGNKLDNQAGWIIQSPNAYIADTRQNAVFTKSETISSIKNELMNLQTLDKIELDGRTFDVSDELKIFALQMTKGKASGSQLRYFYDEYARLVSKDEQGKATEEEQVLRRVIERNLPEDIETLLGDEPTDGESVDPLEERKKKQVIIKVPDDL